MNIHFILVSPTNPGNIGSAARAIKTMGFSSLRFVAPVHHLEEMSLKLAYGSHDILKSAIIYNTLEDALADVDFSIATTAKRRTRFYDYFHPEKARDLVESKSIANLGIVFGREDRGLEDQEIEQCDIISTVPLAQEYPSINLAQCIMIYSYVFHQIKQATSPTFEAEAAEQRILKSRALEVLEALEISKRENLSTRMVERVMQANQDDTHLLLSFHRFLIRKLKQLS
jgi:tRNA/rRNA methyltransferase